jgi:predicted  nucleic acid-binding Zn-ribbon protein
MSDKCPKCGCTDQYYVKNIGYPHNDLYNCGKCHYHWMPKEQSKITRLQGRVKELEARLNSFSNIEDQNRKFMENLIELEAEREVLVTQLKECVKMCDAQAPALPISGYREFVIKNLANALIRKLEGKEKP